MRKESAKLFSLSQYANDACCDYHLTRAEHHLVMTCQHVALGNRKQGDDVFFSGCGFEI